MLAGVNQSGQASPHAVAWGATIKVEVMDNFNFISLYISEFFQNNGLRSYLVFLLGAFGVAILYKMLMFLFRQRL